MFFHRFLQASGTDVLPEYVGGRTDGFAGTLSDRSISLTSLTGGIASSPSEGDVVIVYFATGSIAKRSLGITGYTLLAREFSSDSNSTNFVVACKVMGSTPDTSLTITGGTFDVNGAGAVAVQVWRNVNTTLPVDLVMPPVNTPNTFLPNPPAISPTGYNAVVIAGGGGAYAGSDANYSSSNLENFLSTSGRDTYDAIVGMGSKLVSGTFAADAFTASVGDSGSNSCASFSLALRKKNPSLTAKPTFIGARAYTRASAGTSALYTIPAGTRTGDLLLVIGAKLSGSVSGWSVGSLLGVGRVYFKYAASDYASDSYQTLEQSTSARHTTVCVVIRGGAYNNINNSTFWGTNTATQENTGVYTAATNNGLIGISIGVHIAGATVSCDYGTLAVSTSGVSGNNDTRAMGVVYFDIAACAPKLTWTTTTTSTSALFGAATLIIEGV